MDLTATLITVAAGVAMGAINNVAGGAGVLGFMAFERFCGLPFDIANPSTRPGAVGVGIFAWLGYLRMGLRPESRAWRMGLIAMLGAICGVLIEAQRNEVLFRSYLAIVLLLLLIQQLKKATTGVAPQRAWPPWATLLGSLLIGVHMGYVQIGTGLMATFVLQATYSRDLVATNVAKAAIVILCSIASVAGFALEPWLHPERAVVIAWVPALWLALGTAFGSYFGSKWTVKNGKEAVKKVVVGVALLSLGDQLWHLVSLLRPGG
ncbi:hypothetical protein LBMAG49_01810 [Planctomycetota bacterium]|nr:hypothetical protein LBMAG49_01810 [Planctomycetota bacterium]